MQVVKNILLVLILLPLVIMFFMPKQELYYLLEKKLSEKNIIISDEVLEEGILSLTLKHPVFYFGGAPVAKAEQITLWSVLLYTKADFIAMHIAEGLPTEVSIKDISAVHSILSPMQISISGESTLGAVEGYANTGERIIHIDVAKGGENRAFAKILKKSKKGWYYESKF